jgi:GNAT superfamily N-acetyltransferase
MTSRFHKRGHIKGVRPLTLRLCAIAGRDNSHVHHLFIGEPFQGRGTARALWQLAKAEAIRAGNPGRFTVNSSVNAVPVCERFGFVASGRRVETDRVGFQPMLLVEAKNSR